MMRRLLLWSLLLPCFCAMFGVGAMAAVSCTGTPPSSLSFGSVDILSNPSTSADGTFFVSCSGLGSDETARVCLYFSGGGVNIFRGRTMTYQSPSGTRTLAYSLFVSGSGLPVVYSSTDGYSVYVDLTSTLWYAKVNISGVLASGQTFKPAGTYAEPLQISLFYSTFSGASPYSDCTIPQTNGVTTDISISATIPPNCTVSATALTFPSLITFTADVIGQSAVTVACTTGAPYWVSLDNGQNALSTQRRMRSGANYISYELYSDSGRSQRWGATKDVDTVSGSGVYNGHQLQVYGKIPKPTATPPPGTYSDQIIVTVNF